MVETVVRGAADPDPTQDAAPGLVTLEGRILAKRRLSKKLVSPSLSRVIVGLCKDDRPQFAASGTQLLGRTAASLLRQPHSHLASLAVSACMPHGESQSTSNSMVL